MAAWTILTCEYPPACGGVGDYTAQVAGALAAVGDRVTVCTPRQPGPHDRQPSVDIVLLDDVYGPRARREIDRRLDAERSTVLVQYVPTAFGLGGANLPACRWLLRRSRRSGDDLRVMFHEPYFEFGWTPVHQSLLSLVQRSMARTLLRASSQTYLSTDAWRAYLERPDKSAPFITLPIPSAIPRCERSADSQERRRAYIGRTSDYLVGHFGTYGTHIAPTLRTALTMLLLEDGRVSAVCTGAGSDEFVGHILAETPALRGRLHATNRVPSHEAAAVLSSCDVLLQPYPDGVTTRRTSVMAGLINARAVATTSGRLTEAVWSETRAVAMAPASDPGALVRHVRALLADEEERVALAARGEKTYRERFSLAQTIRQLRASAHGAAA
jgi:glycosyltransferase involved in cell wall biosynthesis